MKQAGWEGWLLLIVTAPTSSFHVGALIAAAAVVVVDRQ